MATQIALPDELARLESALDAAERDARQLVEGLSEREGTWRADPGSWSIAECLDHLATANRVYLGAMRPSAESARNRGQLRRHPALPGMLGGLFVWSLEPPPRRLSRMKAPRAIQPRPSPPLGDAFAAFLTSQSDVRAFLHEYAGIDLAGVTFPNPFIKGLRFSLATGLHVIPAHERRHLWQARRIEQAVRAAG
jgi:hypothetical protein